MSSSKLKYLKLSQSVLLFNLFQLFLKDVSSLRCLLKFSDFVGLFYTRFFNTDLFR